MRTIIAGSKTIVDFALVERAILSAPFLPQITQVFCGMEQGVDILGHRWVVNKKIPIRRFYPDWKGIGKAAGFVRSMEMATFADAAIVVWDGRSHETKFLLDYFKKLDPKVITHIVRVEPIATLVDQGRLAVTTPSSQPTPGPDSATCSGSAPSRPPSSPFASPCHLESNPVPPVSPQAAFATAPHPSHSVGC